MARTQDEGALGVRQGRLGSAQRVPQATHAAGVVTGRPERGERWWAGH